MMDTIKFNKANTKVVAHRGLSGLEPENTVAAFVAAGNRSYYGAECDVHVTKDGKFVVIHDETTKRVASKNVDVEKSKLKKKIQQCEARIEELEGIIASLEEELSSVTDTSKILELTAKYEAAKSELDAKMEEWAELSE